jgi:hypothetical protein
MRRFLAVAMYHTTLTAKTFNKSLNKSWNQSYLAVARRVSEVLIKSIVSGSGQCDPRVDNLAGWRTGAKIKFPV